jgi:hypothetical protein
MEINVQTGETSVDGTVFRYEIRFFAKDQANRFGGKIYDLTVWRDEVEVGYCDRGWYLKCEDDLTQAAMDELIYQFD